MVDRCQAGRELQISCRKLLTASKKANVPVVLVRVWLRNSMFSFTYPPKNVKSETNPPLPFSIYFVESAETFEEELHCMPLTIPTAVAGCEPFDTAILKSQFVMLVACPTCQ